MLALPGLPDTEVVGLFGDRALLAGRGEILVVGLRAGDRRVLTITGIDVSRRVSPVGRGGERRVLSGDDSVRRLDPTTLPAEGTIAAATLPAVVDPPNDFRSGLSILFELPWGADGLYVYSSVDRWAAQLVLQSPGNDRVLVGSPDARCGYTSDPTRTFLGSHLRFGDSGDRSAVAVDADGGIWFGDRVGDDVRLLRLGPEGTLRVLDGTLPSDLQGLHAAPDGSLLVVTGDQSRNRGYSLWRVPDAITATRELPAPAPDCGTTRRVLGPELTTSPIGADQVPPARRQVSDGRGGTWEFSERTGPNGATEAVHRGRG